MVELEQSRDDNNRGAVTTGYGCVHGALGRTNRRRTKPAALECAGVVLAA